MDSPQTHIPQPPLPPLPPLPRRRPSATSTPSASTSSAQTHRRPSSPSSARGRPRLSRQASEIVLPEWQPDSSADHCPICRDNFTFWNRRHHCRKCGRVVCHACSPHRITIPKAFVVQPPLSSTCYPLPPVVVATGTSSAPQRNPHRASWGGPDSDGGLLRRAISDGDEDDGLQVRICDECLGRRSSEGGPGMYTGPQSGRTVPHSRFNYGAPSSHTPYYSSASLPSRRPPQQTYYYAVPGTSRRAELPSSFRASPRLRETDYCPICTLALPPVDPVSGSEELRERHVEVCIRSVSGGSSEPVRGGGGGRRYTGGARMVVWRATEKDCWVVTEDEKQEKAECVICFEEFEEGDVIARLECLCRYHKKCIREWFDRKGNGECPVHAVHD